jgi:N-acylneuraminate cytidylyltransferase
MSAGRTDPASRLLAVVPARGGSRRVPRKNVRPLHGRPAIAYSIDAALESGLFARVVVSTDDAEIAAIAEACGAEVPFLRPAELADDVTPVSAATADALERLDPDGTRYDAVAQLMASCPLRTAEDVRASHAAFAASGAVSQLSVAPYAVQTPWWAMRRADDGTLSPLFPDAVVRRSQDLPTLVCPTGAVWWMRARALRVSRTYHLPGRTGWAMPWERALDIDTEEDWQLASRLLAGRPPVAAPASLATLPVGSAHVP